MDTSGLGTVAEILRDRAAVAPDAAAVLGVDGEHLTYSQLQERSWSIGHQLRDVGVGPADVVMVVLPNGPWMLVGCIATMCTAVCAPVNPGYTRPELEHLSSEIQPAAILTLAGWDHAARDLATSRSIPLVEILPAPTPTLLGPVTGEPGAAGGDVALLLHTAGTTARPKQVPLRHHNLVAAANNVVRSLTLAPDDRCLNVMPLFHSHGLIGAALSTVAAGASIVCAPGMDPRLFFPWANRYDCTWYTAASTIHQLVAKAEGDWPRLRFMRSASGPLAPQVGAVLEARLGAPMIEVYGMTEAYQIAANPLPPGERRPGSVGLPTGTDIALLTGERISADPGVEGEILVRGPAVFAGYSAPPGANDRAFVDGWFCTGDLGRLSEDGYLSITGRVKEQINRGGEKVSPREVEEALFDHPAISDAMVFAIPDEALGEDIAVAVVPSPGQAIDLADIRRFLAGKIAPFKVPRRLLVVDEIPKSATGKMLRIEFAARHAAALAGAPPVVTGDVPEDASTTLRLAHMWRDLLDLRDIPGDDDRFFDLGGDSLAVMELVERIEAELGVDLPLLDLLDVPALGDLAKRVEDTRAGTRQAPLLKRYRSGASGGSLVLVPGQMGLAVGLNLIADAVSADVDVFLFDYPGHRAGQHPLATIEHLAERLVDELQALPPGPLALYGNSLGSWVAFEAGRLLADQGAPPLFVGIGDMYSPVFNGPESPLRPGLARRVNNRGRRYGRQLRAWVRRRGDAPSSSALARRTAVVRASEQAMRSYRSKPFEGPLLIVSAAERAPRFGTTLGWERHTTGPITALRVEGGHSEMHRQQAEPIAQALSRMLTSLMPGRAGATDAS